jgi:hypothetical protein
VRSWRRGWISRARVVAAGIVASAGLVLATPPLTPLAASPITGWHTANSAQFAGGTAGTMTCPAPSVVLGGGVFIGGSGSVNNTYPSDSHTWNGLGTTGFSVDVVCADQPAGYTQVVSAAIANPAGAQTPGDEPCPSGTVVLGGGALPSSSSTTVNLNSSYPTSTGWHVAMNNASALAETFNVYAVCSSAPDGYGITVGPSTSEPGSTAGGSQARAAVSCPSGLVPTGGGVLSSSSSTAENISATDPRNEGPAESWVDWENQGPSAATIAAYVVCVTGPPVPPPSSGCFVGIINPGPNCTLYETRRDATGTEVASEISDVVDFSKGGGVVQSGAVAIVENPNLPQTDPTNWSDVVEFIPVTAGAPPGSPSTSVQQLSEGCGNPNDEFDVSCYPPLSAITQFVVEVQSGRANDFTDCTPFAYLFNGQPVGQVNACSDAALPGLLRVVSSPALPTQILLDGQIADSWGLTWLKETTPGAHTVCFTHVEGWTEPPCQSVTVSAEAVTTVTGTFTQRGSLRVITSPAVRSQISVDGNPTDDWGMWTDIATGSHTVCFGAVAGFNPPGCQTVTVNAGALTTVTGTFTSNPSALGQSGVGSLRVVTSPAVPSQITIKPSAVSAYIADTWGLTGLELAPGSYSVSFGHVTGWTEPAPQTITITAGNTTTVTGTFTQRGFLRVTTSPAVAGTITVDNVPRDDWGMWTDIPTGSHAVCFGAAFGYANTPACQTVTVNPGAETDVTGTYS